MVISGSGRVDREVDRSNTTTNNRVNGSMEQPVYSELFLSWLRRQKPATMTIVALKLGIIFAVRFGLVSEFNIALIRAFPGYLQPWRYITAALYSKGQHLNAILDVYSTYQSCTLLENTAFTVKENLAYMVLLMCIACSILSISIHMSFSGGALIMALITLACNYNVNSIMEFFGFRLNARNVPFTIIAMNMILTARFPTESFVGYSVAYVYTRLNDNPQFNNLFKPPRILMPILTSVTSIIV